MQCLRPEICERLIYGQEMTKKNLEYEVIFNYIGKLSFKFERIYLKIYDCGTVFLKSTFSQQVLRENLQCVSAFCKFAASAKSYLVVQFQISRWTFFYFYFWS